MSADLLLESVKRQRRRQQRSGMRLRSSVRPRNRRGLGARAVRRPIRAGRRRPGRSTRVLATTLPRPGAGAPALRARRRALARRALCRRRPYLALCRRRRARSVVRTTWRSIDLLPAGSDRFPRDLEPAARRTLARVGLATRLWRARLASAHPALVRFINRFHRVPGFEHAVRGYFGGDRARRSARLAIRFAQRLADERPEVRRALAFEPATGRTRRGERVRLVDLTVGSRRYRFVPWAGMSPVAISR